jgi:tape measure domain-containing protein
MTVIGSVEFEASLSLKKFNQDINNLISKNKGLVVPVNAVLNFDAKNQISKVTKTGLPTLVVKVDDKELTKLNKHLELKRTHHKSVQQYFNSNPLTVKTDDRDIDRSIQKVKELKSEIDLLRKGLGGFGDTNITVEHKFPVSPSGGSGGAAVSAAISRATSTISSSVNRSASSIQSSVTSGSAIVQSRISMNTVVLASNIRRTNSLLEHLAKTLPDATGKSVKRYSKDGLIMSVLKAPFKMAGGAIGGAASAVGRGAFENVGRNISIGLGSGKAAKDASKKVKHWMDLTDEYLIGGVDNFMAAFVAEVTRSGNFNKAVEVAMPRLRVMSEYAPKFEKMMAVAGVLDTIRAGGDVPEEIKNLLLEAKMELKGGKTRNIFKSRDDLEHSIKLIKDGGEGSETATTKMTGALFDENTGVIGKFNPQDLIQGYINPLMKELSAITVFIGKIQQNRAISGAKGKMAGVRALFPKLEEGQKGYLQVIGGAVQRQGRGGGYKLESLLEPLAKERKILPVHNPDTDPVGTETTNPALAAVLPILKEIAPAIFENQELYNTALNGVVMAVQTIDPMFQSQAVTDALANILVAIENGVDPKDISTVSYSLGGKEARALADALRILGIEVKTVALAYPEMNASQTDVPNFQATQIVEDGLGFVKNVLKLGGQQNMAVYKAGVIAGPNAHAPKHYFKNEQQVADFFEGLNIELPDASDIAAFASYMEMVENFTEQLTNNAQILSLVETGKLDPKKVVEGTDVGSNDTIIGFLETVYRKQLFKVEGAPGKGSTPEMQAVAKKMIEYQNKAYDALEKKLVELGFSLPKGETREARAGELFGQLKLREVASGLKPFLDSVESGKPNDSYWASGLNTSEMFMKSDNATSAVNWFRGKGALENKDYENAIVKVFESIRKIAVEYHKSAGKLTPAILQLIEEARNIPMLDTVETPLPQEYYDLTSQNLRSADTIPRKDQREFTVPVPDWLKNAPHSAIAYNQLLADVGGQGFVPPIEELKAVGYGMSGAASFIGKDHVYKNEPGNPQAVASEREVEAYKKLAGRYSPLMYAADPGKALVVERVKGKAVKDVLNNLAKPAKEAQEKIAKLTEQLGKTTGESERKTLIEQIAKETANFKKYKIAFNKEAVKIYEQIGRLGKTMIEMGVAHGDLASANVFQMDDGSVTSIDLGNATANPDKAAQINDQLTTIQRAVIDRDFWGILDPMQVTAAISKGYRGESLPEQQPRYASVDDLPKYQDVRPVPLGSEQKGLFEEYLNYKETADAIRVGESGEVLMERKKFRELMAGKLIPQVEAQKIDESAPGWEQSQPATASQKAKKQYKKPEQTHHKFPTPDAAIIKKAQENLQTAQKDLKEKVKLTAKEINSIAHDLKTYFKSETLKKTLQALGQKPTGKNAEDYAKQLSEIAGIDAISAAYQTGGEKGLMPRGKSKKSSLNKERLLEENGYKILKALYAKLNQQLKEKEKELRASVSSMSTASGEKELAKGVSNVSNKASEIFNIVGEVVDELEAVKSQYNIPQSIGQSLSGMLSAVKDYEKKAKVVTDQFLAEGGNLSSIELPQLALPELKIPERELVELPDKLKGLNSNQQMMGLGAGLAGAASVFSGGAAQAATGTLGIVGSGAMTPVAIPIAFTLAAGAGAIAVSKAIQPFLQKNAPNIANILYLNIGSAITGFAGKIKSAFNSKSSSQATKIQGSNTPPLPPLVIPPSNPWQFVQRAIPKLPAPIQSSMAASLAQNVGNFVQNLFQRVTARIRMMQQQKAPTVIQPQMSGSPTTIQSQHSSPPTVIQLPSPPTVNQPQQSGMPAVFNPGATRAAANSVNQSVSSVSKNYSTLAGIIRQLNSSIPAPLKPLVEQIQRLGKTFIFGHIFGFLQNQLRNIASQTFEVTKRFQLLENTINFLSGGTKNGAVQMQFLRDEISRTSSAIEPTLNAYKKLAASTRKTSMEGAVTNKMMSGLMQAGTVFGLTGEELEGSVLAISQIAGKGIVSLEELRGQLAERIPGAMQIAARSMNLTEQELYKLISTGTLSATDFLTKFGPQMLAETSAGVVGASQTAQAALTRLKNSITEIQVAAGKEFQGPIVLGMNALNAVLQIVADHTGTFIQVLQIAAGVALTYAAPAMWAFVKGLWQIPLASVAANMAVNGLKDTIMTLIVPIAAGFLTSIALVWAAVEAFKILADVWDTFFSKTTVQTWSESLIKNLQKSRQEVKDLVKELNKGKATPAPGGKPETEYSITKKRIADERKSENALQKINRFANPLNALNAINPFASTENAQNKELKDSLKQTVVDARQLKQLQQSRASGALKELFDYIDPAKSKDNITRIKELNAQVEILRQKSSLTKDPKSQSQINDQIVQIRKLRDTLGQPLSDGLINVNIELENYQKLAKETNDSKLREEALAAIEVLKAYKIELQNIERQTGAQTTLSELMKVLANIRVEMEMFNRVASELADKNLRAIAETEFKGFTKDVFAASSASLKRSENALELVNNKINISKNAVKGLKELLQDPMFSQYTANYGGDSLERLKIELEGVNEADTQRRKALEALILLREQESSLIGLQREQAEATLALEKEKSQTLLSRFDYYKAEAQGKVQVRESQNLLGVVKGQLSRQIKPYEVDVAKGKISLDTAKQNERIAKISLETLQGYYRKGLISAEEFATRRRDLELQSVQAVQQVAEQELQLRQAVQQLRLDLLDRENQKIEHQLKLRESLAQINQKNSQIQREVVLDTRTRSGEDAQTQITRQTEDETLAVQFQTSTAYKQELQRRLSILQEYYAKGEIAQREYEDRSRQIEQDITSTTLQLKDYELQQHQRINQRIIEDRDRMYSRMVEDFERATKKQENILQLSAIRQEQIVRQKQLGQIDLIGSQRAEQQSAIALTQIQGDQAKKQLKETLTQIKQVAKLRQQNALTEREAEERTADLTIKAEQLKLDLINKQIEKSRQLKDLKILALDDESSRIDLIFQQQEMGYSYGLEKRKQIVESLDREKTVMEAQVKLQQSLFKGEEQRRQAALDRSRSAEDLLGRLPDLQKRAADNSINFAEYKGTRYLMDLIRKMAGAGSGSTFLSESDIRDLRTKQFNQSALEEKKLLEMKTRQLEQQQKIQNAQMQLQKVINKLTAENAIMEASISLNKARQAELQAKIALEKANVNGDPREIQNAQQAYDLTKQGTQLSQQQLGIAVDKLTVSNQIAGIDQQALASDQNNERFALQEANRKALQDTALRGGELASQGAINVDQIIQVDMSSIKFDLSPITPMVDLTSQINTKLDSLLTAIEGLINKPTAPNVENLTVVSSDPTGDSRQVLADWTRAKNMY